MLQQHVISEAKNYGSTGANMKLTGLLQDWRWQDNKRQKGAAEPSWGRPDVVKDARKTVYVKNLPYAATEEDITGFFAACGEVVDLHRGMTDGALTLALDTLSPEWRSLKGKSCTSLRYLATNV